MGIGRKWEWRDRGTCACESVCVCVLGGGRGSACACVSSAGVRSARNADVRVCARAYTPAAEKFVSATRSRVSWHCGSFRASRVMYTFAVCNCGAMIRTLIATIRTLLASIRTLVASIRTLIATIPTLIARGYPHRYSDRGTDGAQSAAERPQL